LCAPARYVEATLTLDMIHAIAGPSLCQLI
jgi:hypothetical protein